MPLATRKEDDDDHVADNTARNGVGGEGGGSGDGTGSSSDEDRSTESLQVFLEPVEVNFPSKKLSSLIYSLLSLIN